MIKFKEVAHHYFGCMAADNLTGNKVLFEANLLHETKLVSSTTYRPLLKSLTHIAPSHITKLLSLNKDKKVILVRLGSRKVFYRIQLTSTRKSQIYSARLPVIPASAQAVHFACSKGYDLFNLIENNEALDATKH